MLNVTDLINIQYIPKITDISLMLLVDFYEQYLCKRIFIFELVDGRRIKIFFKDTSEIFHVAGINHIYGNMQMDGTHFIDGIKNKSIDFSTLENINKAAYTDYIDRIRGFACIDTVLKNCDYLWFPSGMIPDSTIKVKYLLLKGLDDKNLHLGIDSYKEGRPYFSKTFLVTDGKGLSKYVDKAENRLRVMSIEIIDKDTNAVVETVDRDAAIIKADEIILELAYCWIKRSFPKQMDAYKIRYGLCIPNSRKKKEWISLLSEYLEKKQDYIRTEVMKYDPYWTSKIVATNIRKFIKENAIGLIDDALNKGI